MPHSTDLAVIGGGIFGLSIANAAVKKGLTVTVVEEHTIGAGASGSVLGALMPEDVVPWDDNKQFQFEALFGLDTYIQELESDTGLSTGYRRCGRVLPIRDKTSLSHHLDLAQESLRRWSSDETGYSYMVEDSNSHATWISPKAAPLGVVYETLSARVSPHQYLDVTAKALEGKVQMLLGQSFAGYQNGTVTFSNGDTLEAGQVVLATGKSAFDQLETFTGKHVGEGEKGQFVLMEGSGLEVMPAVSCDGLFVVPHDNHTVAVGTVSEQVFDHERPDPTVTEAIAEKARTFCPALARRKVLGAMSGVRPRCNTRMPLAGPVPDVAGLYVATGGYRISFGIAHRIAAAVVAELCGDDYGPKLPASYRPEAHFIAEPA